VALILTAARIVWIVSLITSIVGWWCIRKKYELSITGQRIVILLALIVGVIFLPFILNRLGSLNKTIDIDNGGLTYRWRHVLVARDIMINNPIGVGLNVFQYSMLNNYEPRFYMNDPTPAHNILAEIGADLGVLGLVLFVFLYYKLFARKLEMLNTVRIKRAFDPILIGTFLSMISYLLISQAHPWLLSAPVAYVFWILAGLNHYEV
jgi:O-antigen ligase